MDPQGMARGFAAMVVMVAIIGVLVGIIGLKLFEYLWAHISIRWVQ